VVKKLEFASIADASTYTCQLSKILIMLSDTLLILTNFLIKNEVHKLNVCKIFWQGNDNDFYICNKSTCHFMFKYTCIKYY
jgi:hypothetical protein